MASADDEKAHSNEIRDASPGHKSLRFRFKRNHPRPSGKEEDTSERHSHRSHRRHHHHHHHQYRSKRRKIASDQLDDPSAYDDSVSGLPSDTAFRESLFDALGDDEGAAFWQGVYGQPIHTYPNTYKDEESGELESMNDEEYAQYVRRRMWEKSWEGIEAAKEEKRKEREHEKQNVRAEEHARNRRQVPKEEPDYLFDLNIEKSLRRGERRRDRKRFLGLWTEYLQRWEDLQALREAWRSSENKEQLFLRNKIAWPVETGKRKDLNHEEIERFFKHCADALDDSESKLNNMLKSERVRWHPDKIQQRYGFMGIDELTMQGVTSVFQVLDRMWHDQRDRS